MGHLDRDVRFILRGTQSRDKRVRSTERRIVHLAPDRIGP